MKENPWDKKRLVNETNPSSANTIWVNDGSFKNDYFCIKRIEIIDLEGNPVPQALEYGKKYILRMTVHCKQNTMSIKHNTKPILFISNHICIDSYINNSNNTVHIRINIYAQFLRFFNPIFKIL